MPNGRVVNGFSNGFNHFSNAFAKNSNGLWNFFQRFFPTLPTASRTAFFNAVDEHLQEDQRGVLVTNRLPNVFSDWEQTSTQVEDQVANEIEP